MLGDETGTEEAEEEIEMVGVGDVFLVGTSLFDFDICFFSSYSCNQAFFPNFVVLGVDVGGGDGEEGETREEEEEEGVSVLLGGGDATSPMLLRRFSVRTKTFLASDARGDVIVEVLFGEVIRLAF